MKNSWKKYLAFVLAFLMIASLLAGCSGGDSKKSKDDEDEKEAETAADFESAEDLFDAVAKNLKDIESSEQAISIALNMGDDEMTLELAMDLDMELTADPIATHGTGTMDIKMGDLIDESMDIETYLIDEDGEYVSYTNIGDEWTKQTTELDIDKNNYVADFKKLKKVADSFEILEDTEKVNKEECIVVEGELSAEDMDVFTSIGASGQDFSEMFEWDNAEDATIPVSIMIYQETLLPAAMEIDMKDVAGAAMEEEEVAVDEFTIAITYNDYDTVDEITLPEEAAGAVESSSMLDAITSGGSEETVPADTGESDGEITGTYKLFSIMGMELTELNEALDDELTADSLVLELRADGTGTFTVEGESGDITWKADGSTITIEDGTDTMTGTIGDGTIDLDIDGESCVMKKDGAAAPSDSGSSDSGSTPAAVAQASDLGSDWKSFNVQVGDKVVTLPCTLDDLKATGLTLDTDTTPEDYMINAGETGYTFFDSSSGSFAYIGIGVYNPESKALPITDCVVYSISCDSFSAEDGLSITVPGGITLGSTKEDMLAAYGEADDLYEGDSYDYYTWYVDKDDWYKSLEISIKKETGLVDDIEVSNRP